MKVHELLDRLDGIPDDADVLVTWGESTSTEGFENMRVAGYCPTACMDEVGNVIWAEPENAVVLVRYL